MKRVLITGSNGTVGTALRQHLEAQNIEVIGWNRQQVPIDNYDAMQHFVRGTKPDVLFHLATASKPVGMENESWHVNYVWTSELAWITRQLGIKFLFTSSVMVYTDDAKGPFTPDTKPDASEGYGYEKRMAEERVLYQNPEAIVARIGWQIGDNPDSNTMMRFFAKQIVEHGQINTSTKWYPACSFLEDTASALYDLAQGDSGLYLVDSNKKWTFYEIVTALNHLHGNQWKIAPNEDFVYDQRMIDARVKIPSLRERLQTLPE